MTAAPLCYPKKILLANDFFTYKQRDDRRLTSRIHEGYQLARKFDSGSFIRHQRVATPAQTTSTRTTAQPYRAHQLTADDSIKSLITLIMSSGLTRRRGVGGSGVNAEGEGSNNVSRANSTTNVRDGAPETSYENGENGHKIAYDPRDLSESAERSKQPKLTMMEEVLLLGLKDKQVRLFATHTQHSSSTQLPGLTFFPLGLPFFLER